MTKPSGGPAGGPSVDPSGGSDGARRVPPAALAVAGVLILAAIVIPLLVNTYADDGPRLWGFPFFFWYQLLWVFIASACTYSAYLIIERKRRPGPDERPAAGPDAREDLR